MSDKRVSAIINLRNIEENISLLYEHMPVKKPIMAVIKANGYGHGSIRIAQMLDENEKIYGFATATAEEALTLRNAGITKPILILGYVFEEDYDSLIVNNITLTVFDKISAAELDAHAKALDMKAKVHLKIDTGMSRIGVQCNDEGFETALAISSYKSIDIGGVFTHFARADENDISPALCQLDKFNDFVKRLNDAGICPEIVHCANSASILQVEKAHISIVRAGIVIYGLWPSDEIISNEVKLLPAMTLKSHIVHIKWIDEGTAVSYGGTFVAKRRTRVATIPVGYADGYPRSLSNKGYVLINGEKANIIGRVCMDQMMVDVTDISAEVLDETVLLGQSGERKITAEEIGALSGRFNYEFVCDISSRVPRIYIY